MIPLTLFLFIAPGLLAQQQNEEETTLLARNINKALTEPGRPNYNYQDRKKQKKEIADYYRHHKALSADYEGYVIELTTSDLPLKRDYFLFEQFGSVYYDKLKKGGYAYCIKVNFSSRKSILHFVENIILPKAPEARVVEYKKGKRKYRK